MSERIQIQGGQERLDWLFEVSARLHWGIDAMEINSFVAGVFWDHQRPFDSKRWWEMVNEHREVS